MGACVSKPIGTPPRYYGTPAYYSPSPFDAPPSTVIPNRSRRFAHIADQYETLEQVIQDLRNDGLESSKLIVGIDFTKSNEWTGKFCFNGRSLHAISNILNPYEKAISIIGRTLSSFDEDKLIPCFGFGDENKACHGFEEALLRYREIVPYLSLSGPTSFAPIIRAAIDIVEETGGQYHILLIVADGQVTSSTSPGYNMLSKQEEDTISAIVDASKYALSIVLVGVGDGPWDTMMKFDDNIPDRRFDNFQFVNFTEIMSEKISEEQKEASFALSALMEIPVQYKATMEYGILSRKMNKARTAFPLPPPKEVLDHDASAYTYSSSNTPYISFGSYYKMGYRGTPT